MTDPALSSLFPALRDESDPDKSGIGASVLRTEDARFVLGRGRFVADIMLPGERFACFVRSVHPSARLLGLDTTQAAAVPGVVAVFTGAELVADGLGGIPWEVRPPPDGMPPGDLPPRGDLPPLGDPSVAPPQPVMAHDRVRYVGEIVAMVVAESEHVASEAAELVAVDYDPLPAVIATADAVAAGAPAVWQEFPDNVCFTVAGGDIGAVRAAFARAAHVARIDLVNQRIQGNPVEPRAYIAAFDAAGGRYVLYASAGKPHPVRNTLADDIFRVPRDRIRVIAPDIGGGFGAKNVLYPEQCALLWAARKLGRPIKWIQQRIEAAQSDMQARDQVNHVELALDADGRFLALEVDSLAALGAYLAPRGVTAPAHHKHLLSGLYAIPLIAFRVRAVHTNTVPTCPIRGAGAPEAIYIVERAIDFAAREIGLDAAEIRRRNTIPEALMPFTTAQNITYDSGQFEPNMDRAMALAGWDGFAARRAQAAERGRLRGIGIGNTIESHGFGISESAEIRIDADGNGEILIGTMSSGQGHATVYAQIAAEVLGLGLDRFTVVQGDTDRIKEGSGTGASRSLIVGGAALEAAAEIVIENGRRVAARAMEAAADDIEYAKGEFRIAGTDRVISLAEVARAEPGLHGRHRFDPTASTYPNGCHVAEVEIDPETGTVALVAYAMVQDAGRIVNPVIVAGQLHGGVAHGIGQALMERTVYDPASGQMLSGTWLDYCMPRADDLPSFVYEANQVPCLTNPLGVKAAGESGPVAAPPAVIGAICDALRDYGITDVPMPATAETVWRLIRDAEVRIKDS